MDNDDAPEVGKELVGMVRDPIGAAKVPEDAGRESELGLMAAGSDSAPVGKLTRIQIRKKIRKKSCMMVSTLSFIDIPLHLVVPGDIAQRAFLAICAHRSESLLVYCVIE